MESEYGDENGRTEVGKTGIEQSKSHKEGMKGSKEGSFEVSLAKGGTS